jgi:hypothetical protein
MTAGTRLPLSLQANGSLFIVFRDGPARPYLRAAPTDVDIVEVAREQVLVRTANNGPISVTTASGQEWAINVAGLPTPITLSQLWTLKFLSGRGAPDSMSLESLQSWTEFPDERVRHYAGIVQYSTTFEVPESWLAEYRGIRLDLGKLWAVGRVTVNDHDLGILWKPPYVVDVTDCVKPGTNQLVVEIANTWSNRLVGDAHLPPEQRIARTNITRSGTPGKPWKDVPLNESGLLGPVRLIPNTVVTLQE